MKRSKFLLSCIPLLLSSALLHFPSGSWASSMINPGIEGPGIFPLSYILESGDLFWWELDDGRRVAVVEDSEPTAALTHFIFLFDGTDQLLGHGKGLVDGDLFVGTLYHISGKKESFTISASIEDGEIRFLFNLGGQLHPGLRKTEFKNQK